ncbi:hypothetical protein FOL47_006416 [Perkinsus chesapeaki]|uniref:Uncharacterized protein n=1 Tax=Perkinsus chesapeaki TaxID=330153 RepID=A0A7J6LS49_PERCH|nr:hypothetical protein FOL47_006416 [Perkinsus chesapeaki]
MEELNWWTIEAYCCLARMQPRLVVGNEKIDTNAEMIEKIFAAVCEMHASRSDIFGEIMIAAAKLNAQPSERVQHLLAVKASDGIGKVGSVRKLLQLADATQRQDLIDYCLLHDIAKEATKFLGKMEIFQLVQILGIFARSEVFDGEFMDKARERFLNLLAREKPEVTAQQLLVMMTVVSRLNTCLDPEQEILDLLCVRAKRYASTLNETATTQLLLAVQKRRPILSSAVRDLLAAVGERNLSDWSASNSATVFCTLSKLSNFSEKLAIGCLRTIKKKGTGKLAAAQIQQLLAVLSHHMEEIPEPIMKSTLKSLLESLCRPAVIASLNQVQIVALLTAFSKLKIRPETATGALIRALTNDPEFTEEIKFQKKISTIGERKFSVMKMVEFLTAENQLDPAHWTSVLAAIEDLKIWNSTTVHICLILRSLLLHNGLHGLRAIHLAQAMKPFCNREWLDLATNEFVGEVDEEVERALEHLTEVNGHRFESGGENIWLAEFGRACIGALQRHEVYLISTWSVLTSDEKVPIFINQWWGDALRKCKISRFDMSVEVLLAEEVVGNILSSSTLSARDDSGESISAVDSMSDFPEIFSASSESSTPLSQFMENLSEGLAANACRRYSFGCDLRSEESSVYEVDTISDTSKAALEDDVNFEFAVDCVSSACFFHDFEIESVISDLEGKQIDRAIDLTQRFPNTGYMEIEEVTEELLYQLYEATFKGVGEMEEKMELPLERERLNFALIQESFLSAFGIPPNADGNDDVPIVSYGSPKRQSATAIRSKKMIPVIASTGVADLRHFTANNERDASARTMMREEIAGLEMKISGMRTRLKGLLEAKQERISPKREHVDEIDDELMKSKLWMRNARDVLQRHEKLWREVRELEAANLMESSAFKNVLAIGQSLFLEEVWEIFGNFGEVFERVSEKLFD